MCLVCALYSSLLTLLYSKTAQRDKTNDRAPPCYNERQLATYTHNRWKHGCQSETKQMSLFARNAGTHVRIVFTMQQILMHLYNA